MLSNVDISAMAIPDFVAGFVFGMTGDNKLTEIESCYQGGQLMTQEIETGIADIKKGGVDNDIQAGLQFALAALQIPQALSTCESMGDDLTAIEQWASIFKNPSKLATKVGLHYATHKSEVTADISTLESDWDSQKYFDAGKELADLATILVGPIKKEEEEYGTSVDCGTFSLNTKEIADFAAGFVAGFTGDDYQTYFESCLTDSADFETQMCNAVNGFMTKNNQKMVEGVHIVLTQIPVLAGFLGACPNAAADVQTVENWGKYWESQGSLKVYSTAYRNLVGNISTVTADVALLTDDFDAGNFYGTAMEAAALAKLALPVPSETTVGDVKCADFELSTKIIADYLAGFMGGFTGNNNKADMEACFADSPQFETDVCEFVADFRTKENQKVLEGLQKLLGDLPLINSFMSTCPANVKADHDVVASWFKYWKSQGEMKVYSTAYRNVVSHMSDIKTLSSDISTKYDSQDYYNVAVDVSSIAKIALPVMTLGDVEDTCYALTSSASCQANSECSWCEAGAVADACHSKANAAALPAGVFNCSGLGATFLQ